MAAVLPVLLATESPDVTSGGACSRAIFGASLTEQPVYVFPSGPLSLAFSYVVEPIGQHLGWPSDVM